MNRIARVFRSLACLTMIVLLLTAQLPAKAAVSGSTTLATKGSKYVVTASSLNFRSGPGVGYGVIKGLRRGTTVTYVDYSHGWWLVKTSNGQTGYVDRKYLTPAAASKTGVYYVTASNLRIRKSPSTSSGTRGYASKGARLTISQLNGDWGYVSGGAEATGWVALKYLSSTGSASSSSSSGATSGSHYVTASRLNVRKSASRSSSHLGVLTYGASVTVKRKSGSWSYITYYESGVSKSGWVNSAYIRAK